jgi:hypothetical protein
MQSYPYPVHRLASGAVAVKTGVPIFWTWVAASGEVVASVGGIGAIQWAIRLKRRRE